MTSVVEMASAFELWSGMNDGSVSRNDIEACISRVVTRGGNIKDLVVIWAIIRDIDGDSGWRDGSKWLFIELYKYFPETMIQLLDIIPKYGSWLDYKSLYTLAINEGYLLLSNIIEEIWVNTILDDHRKVLSGCDRSELTLCSKYIPKEGRSLDKRFGVVRRLVKRSFPEMRSLSLGKRRWRKMCSSINRVLGVTEGKMNGNWSGIKFENVPKGCLYRNMDSFLNRNKRKVDIDRVICRSNCIRYLRQLRKNDSENREMSMEDVVRSIRLSDYKLDYTREAKYESILVMERARLVPYENVNGIIVADMTNSMERNEKLDQVISTTILACEVRGRCGSIFHSSYINTGISPIWRNLIYPNTEEEYNEIARDILGDSFRVSRGSACKDWRIKNYNLLEAVKMCKFSRGGGNIVDIVKCYEDILIKGIESFNENDMVSWMLLMTDIDYRHMTMYIGRNKYKTLSKYDNYFTNLKFKDMDEVFQHLEGVFEENGFSLPRLIYYNMSVEMEPSIKESPYLVEVVGYVGDILERVYKDDYYIETDEDKFNRLKEDERYNEVYKIIDLTDEIYI